jgi:phospholipase C
MATNFGTSDRWFSPIMSRTQLNRMYMMAATSQGYVYPIGSNTNDATVLTAKPIFQELQDAGITWKIYVDPTNVSDSNGACSATAVSDANGMCLIAASYINMFAYESTIINSAGKTPDLLLNIVPIGQFAIDAAAGTLPQFALIEPASNAGLDEHPSDTDQFPVNVQDGATYASGLINTLMQSKSWTDSALIFTYDESGDLYDHVPPQPAAPPGDVAAPVDLEPSDICDSASTDGGQLCNFGWTGYRVPTIVISPYTIKNFVSHTVRDTTSVLAMVEARFGVAALTGRDAAQPSMNEFFDFVNKPWATPPTPPTQNTGEPCDQTPPASWNEPPILTVVVSGTGGTVASSPAGIDNCASTGGACSAPYSSGTAVTLTATPASGTTFTGWSGAGCSGTSTCSVTVTGATSVTATFSN